jgi:hypothetical protein
LAGAGYLARAGREFIRRDGNAPGYNWFHEINVSGPDFTQMPALEGAQLESLRPGNPCGRFPPASAPRVFSAAVWFLLP